ncbi:MAG: PA14 domain-containing protein [Chloroflexota bacterium]
MKKNIWLIITLLMVVGMFPLSTAAAPLNKLSWRAEYYSNNSLSGSPTLSRFEDSMNHNWGMEAPAPDLPKDNFSARWSRSMHFEKGTYLFLLTVDDGARVWLDGDLIIDAWSLGHKDRQKAKVRIEKSGEYHLQVAYFDKSGDASINLDWVVLGDGDDIVGAWHAEYFTNRNLEGSPVVTRQDPAISFDWNSGAPDPKVTRDNFSVRWTRSIYMEAGTYKLRVQHDDGMRIFVNDKSVYDSWKDQRVGYHTPEIEVETGHHTFRVEYYDHLGNAIAVMKIDEDPGNYDDTDNDNNTDTSDTDDNSSTPAKSVVIVDNKGSGFQWGGPVSSRFASRGGYGTGFFWTYNTNSVVVNSGKWTPSLAAGNYEVYAFVPSINATTGAARYRIQHSGTQAARVVNQNRFSNTWVSLGVYKFSGDGQEYVALYDSTSEAEGSTQVAFDAIKFVKR